MADRDIIKTSRELHPYPADYHVRARTSKGVDIFIRPLLQTDLALFKEFLHSLSPRSVYYRFFSYIREFSEQMLAQLIQADQKNHIALAAFHEIDSRVIMLGVSRLFIEKNPPAAEVSVVVADQWQGKGIGAELFSQCLEIGASLGVQKIWGLVLAENTQMLKLARKLNFEVRREKGSSDYFVSRDYSK